MKTLLLLTALAALPLGLFAPRASEADPVAPANYKIDASHSAVMFRVKHMGVSWFYGRFNEFSGKVAWDAAKPEASTLELSIDPASVDTHNKDRDDHLRKPDFFSVKEFPAVTFKSTKVAKKGDKLEVTGELELHGVKKTITVPVEHVGTADTERGSKAGFEATIDIKRSDFGMSYGLPDALGDDVRIMISLECDKG